ncbi:MAG: helix-turn-helix transcriptional regulator [Crocosphaera sp.]|nr:helix-turn-helix transcriptional regulator [Crocosphaera sp.]
MMTAMPTIFKGFRDSFTTIRTINGGIFGVNFNYQQASFLGKDKQMKYQIDIEKLTSLIRSKQGKRTLREVGKEIGNVSFSTISRIQNGKTPDINTFLALCEWLGVSPAKLIKNTEEKEDIDTPEAIAIILRSDKNLAPEIANALAFLIKGAYQDLSSYPVVGEPDRGRSSKPKYTLEELLAEASSEDFKGE